MHSPQRSTPRDKAITELYRLFRRAGFEGVSIAEISAATGLGRSSLYHYFPGGKADMAIAVLDFAGKFLRHQVIAALQAPGDPRARLERMIAAVDALYLGGKEPCIIASMQMGSPDPALQQALSSLLGEWLDALGTVLMEAGLAPPAARQRAALIIGRIEGGLLLARALCDARYFDEAIDRVRQEAWAPTS